MCLSTDGDYHANLSVKGLFSNKILNMRVYFV